MLEVAISEKRAKMIAVGLAKGYSHPETVRISQELELLINQVMFRYKRKSIRSLGSKA